MDWMYLFYFLLAALICSGAKSTGRGNWNEEYTSLKQTKILQGIAVLGVALHHMGQKTSASWIPRSFVVHGLDPFISVGYLFVGVFFFCSGLGLYRSLKTKPDYLKGFLRNRILLIVIAYYLSGILYTALRLIAGEKLNTADILRYLSGLRMANPDSWFLIVIPFFYLAFWASFRYIKKEGAAILSIFIFTLAYMLLGAAISSQRNWWMQGEWWYNSILLFPLGLVFGRFEGKITGALKKGYWFWLLLFFAGSILLFLQSEWLISHRLGYYGGMIRRLLSAGIQGLSALFFVMFWFVLMLKVRLGNRVLAWLGAVTLDFYLVHRIFVDLFGYSFLDSGRRILYIRSLPLYTAAVLAGSGAAVVLFRFVRLRLTGWICRNRKTAELPGEKTNPPESDALLRARKKAEGPGKGVRLLKKWFWPAAGVILLAAGYFALRPSPEFAYGGVVISPPEGYVLSSADSRYRIWKYAGNDKNPNTLVLDTGIRGDKGQLFGTAEEVLENCGWITEGEVYVNPQGIRMARGFSTKGTDDPMRRYYVETDRNVVLLSIIENRTYYDPAACEEAILQAADGIRRQR